MDLISAIGLAYAILSFIDYAHRVVTGADDLYELVTGATAENARTQNVAIDIDVAAYRLTKLRGKTKYEKALNDLAAKCKKIVNDRITLISKLAASGTRSTWKVLKVAIRNLRKEIGPVFPLNGPRLYD